MLKRKKNGGVDHSSKVGGYNPPPAEMRFKKGNQAAKGHGRPPSKNIAEMAKEIGEQQHGRTGKTKDEHLLEVLHRRGCQGDDKAASLYLGYRFGRPLQQSINVNENTTVMSQEEADALLKAHLGQVPNLLASGVPSLDVEQARKRIQELLEKGRKKTIVEPTITPGSEAVQ